MVFREQYSTSQILTILRIIEGVRPENIDATLLFVDSFKEFNSIHSYILTFYRPFGLRISKQDVHQYLKVNKKQRKWNAGYVGRVRKRPKNI